MTRVTISILFFLVIIFLFMGMRLIWQADRDFVASQSPSVKTVSPKE